MERERLKAAAGSRVSLVGVAVGSRALRAVVSKECCLVCNAQPAVGKESVPVTQQQQQQQQQQCAAAGQMRRLLAYAGAQSESFTRSCAGVGGACDWGAGGSWGG